ncbi:UNVERIFIED_CONTAM: hypothetical protein Sradi_2094700 [Sesamum radiatum]|uniref:Zinc finger PMZ-type domain-containing protein n=1 Tax=Sesamum radiatum TaxID=300843 RepID=A0AAW2TJC3_SESRA
MSLRHQVLVDLPDLKYHKYDYLNKLGESWVTWDLRSFRQLELHTEIVKFTEAYNPQNKIFTVYLVGGESKTEPNVEPQTEPSVEPQTVRNVEPQTERNIQKRKGVVVENADNSDFNESEWDEVFNIVDSYANDYEQDGVENHNEGEGEGQGEEESDRLFESGLEDSEYEIDADDDTEQGDQTEVKKKALNAIQGKAKDQFECLWDYAVEVRSSNPGSLWRCSVNCSVHRPNNNLSYAVVAGETRESWQWFLELLKGDLHIVRNDSYTFISDKQKGLIPAFECVFPGADNRFCVRHMHNNMKTTGLRGLAFKKGLWNAAKFTTVSEFIFRMQELGKLDVKLLEWLSDKPPAHWSSSHFNTFPKCDMLNNICESFNSNILEAREKPILTMLEWVREWIMTRLSDLRDRVRKKWQNKKICPKIKKIVEKNIDKAADCIPIKSDDVYYEISCYDGARYVVNLQNKTCTCRKWDLIGIPCRYGMSTQNMDPEDFVNPCYSVAISIEVYKHAILLANGPKLWEKTGMIPPLPPNFGRSAGRPPRARRLEPDEPSKIGKKKTRGQ